MLKIFCLIIPAALLATAPARGDVPFTCTARLESARAALLLAHFDPASDTQKWLKITGLTDGGIMLDVHTVYSPDGDGLRFYRAELHPRRGANANIWHLKRQKVLDEFKDERLPENTWTRSRSGWLASIHTRTEDTKLVELFVSIVRPAMEDCLAHPNTVGKLERCSYSAEQARWNCKTW